MSDYWKNSSEKRRSHEAVQRLGMHNQSASIRSHLMSEISPQSSLSGKGVTAFPNARQKQKARIMGSLRDQDDGPGGLERFTAVLHPYGTHDGSRAKPHADHYGGDPKLR